MRISAGPIRAGTILRSIEIAFGTYRDQRRSGDEDTDKEAASMRRIGNEIN